MANVQNDKKADSLQSLEGQTCNRLICNKIQSQAGIEEVSKSENPIKYWFAMRDLKPHNAKLPAYKQMKDLKIEYFTPMWERLIIKKNKRVREEVPFIQDLLFVHDTLEHLDTIVEKTPTLQYRYQKGKPYCEPMVVPDGDMERFINAVNSTENHRYYLPGEITPNMYRHKIRIVGGALNGYEGMLLTTRGSRVKRILVELPTWLNVAVEVDPEYIQLL